jgi:hypothetical protein
MILAVFDCLGIDRFQFGEDGVFVAAMLARHIGPQCRDARPDIAAFQQPAGLHGCALWFVSRRPHRFGANRAAYIIAAE